MVVLPFDNRNSRIWDEFIDASPVGTFLHSRKFLSYHGERFDDRSLMVFDDAENLLAVFPAAESPDDSSILVSHPGATFGGIVGSEKCRGETMLAALSGICCFLKDNGFDRLLYKAVPFFYHGRPMQDDLYALFRIGGIRYRCDISALIDLDNRGRIGSRRKRGYKKAVKSGLKIESGNQFVEPFWRVLAENLREKHDAKPVHSLQEITTLLERFPENMEIVVASSENDVEAGVLLFHSTRVSHAQYICSSAHGRDCNALDLLFEHAIAEAERSGARFFDFGISNEDGGFKLNEGLYSFKLEYGAGSAVHEFYALDLRES